MKFKQLRQESWMRPPQDEPEFARQEDWLRCRLLFERHGRASNLDLSRGEAYASFSSVETRAAWDAWCAALNLAGSHLDPNLSDIDWWTRCANKRSPNFEYVPPGAEPVFQNYAQLGEGPIRIDREEAWMLPLKYRAMLEGADMEIYEEEGMAAYLTAVLTASGDFERGPSI